jgi:hypothetical protein
MDDHEHQPSPGASADQPARHPGKDVVGDDFPRGAQLIEVHVVELKQLFNAIDPSPFREKDLAADVEEFIVGWSRELSRDAPLALLVHVDRPAGPPDEPAMLRDSIRQFFRQRSRSDHQRLRQLLRRGRTSLAIGLVFLGASIAASDMVAGALSGRRFGELVRESLLIGGWVAMWKPLEVFLYDWWPIRADVRLFERLGAMPVRIAYSHQGRSEAWREDWPATAPVAKPSLGPDAHSSGMVPKG